jgi:hypothetical protein
MSLQATGQTLTLNTSGKLDNAKLMKEESKKAKLIMKGLKLGRSESNENLPNLNQLGLPLIAVKATLSPRKLVKGQSPTANDETTVTESFKAPAQESSSKDPLKMFTFPDIKPSRSVKVEASTAVSDKLISSDSLTISEKKLKKKSSSSLTTRSYKYKVS